MVEPTIKKNASTKIGKSFLTLFDLLFLKNYIYNSSNKNKVSYSCKQNIKSVINNTDEKVLNNRLRKAAIAEIGTAAL